MKLNRWYSPFVFSNEKFTLEKVTFHVKIRRWHPWFIWQILKILATVRISIRFGRRST